MSTYNDAIDYSEVLRDLTERRDELDAAIRAIARLVGHAVAATPVAAVPSGPRQYGRTGDTANGLTSPSAAAATIRAALDKTNP